MGAHFLRAFLVWLHLRLLTVSVRLFFFLLLFFFLQWREWSRRGPASCGCLTPFDYASSCCAVFISPVRRAQGGVMVSWHWFLVRQQFFNVFFGFAHLWWWQMKTVWFSFAHSNSFGLSSFDRAVTSCKNLFFVLYQNFVHFLAGPLSLCFIEHFPYHLRYWLALPSQVVFNH